MKPLHRWWAFVPLLLATVGCTSLADVGVTYRVCRPENERPYQEKFDIETSDLERCWKIDKGAKGAVGTKETEIFTSPLPGVPGDLVIRPRRGLRWSKDSAGPVVFRQMTGDFLVVTRAEATSSISRILSLEPPTTASRC